MGRVSIRSGRVGVGSDAVLAQRPAAEIYVLALTRLYASAETTMALPAPYPMPASIRQRWPMLGRGPGDALEFQDAEQRAICMPSAIRIQPVSP